MLSLNQEKLTYSLQRTIVHVRMSGPCWVLGEMQYMACQTYTVLNKKRQDKSTTTFNLIQKWTNTVQTDASSPAVHSTLCSTGVQTHDQQTARLGPHPPSAPSLLYHTTQPYINRYSDIFHRYKVRGTNFGSRLILKIKGVVIVWL